MSKFSFFFLVIAIASGFIETPVPTYTRPSNTKSSDGALEEATKAIEASNALYFQAFVKNDPAIFISCYAEDACIMAPNVISMCGRIETTRFFRAAYDTYGMRNGKFITTAIYGNGGEYVTEEGIWQSYDSTEKLFDEGKYLVLWKKTQQGWKMYRDSFSSNHTDKK